MSSVSRSSGAFWDTMTALAKDGKEGVIGSSPMEGSQENPANPGVSCVPVGSIRERTKAVRCVGTRVLVALRLPQVARRIVASRSSCYSGRSSIQSPTRTSRQRTLWRAAVMDGSQR